MWWQIRAENEFLVICNLIAQPRAINNEVLDESFFLSLNLEIFFCLFLKNNYYRTFGLSY